jgi:DNA helicase HerA-like ATPase
MNVRAGFSAERSIGHVSAISGVCLDIELANSSAAEITVGDVVAIPSIDATILSIVTRVAAPCAPGSAATCSVSVLGEVRSQASGREELVRGAARLPTLGQAVCALRREDLDYIFRAPNADGIRIGDLHQAPGVGAFARVDDLVKKHFAVLGSTGVGKSSGVSVLVNAILDAKPDLRVFFVDPHNEYGGCFHPRADVKTPTNLRLPFWLFNFEEFVDVLFRGRPGVEQEIDILAELIPLAKASFAASRASHERTTLKRADTKVAGLSPDTPVPYRLADLIALIEDRRGKLENRALVFNYTRLLNRIDTVRQDARYAFMFDNANVGGDSMVEVIADLFKYPSKGKTVTIVQLAGFPAEVADSVASVLCRMAFEIGVWSDGTLPMLVVCEEAHRYAPADRSLGFGPTRKALSRIAKEGRKYGIYLGLVTQRPAELDPTIISQCSTVFAMRLLNDRDQAILRAAVSDAAGDLLGLLPALGGREAFGFGEGMPLPVRIRFSELPPARIPRSETTPQTLVAGSSIDTTYIASVVSRWRGSPTRTQAGDELWTMPDHVTSTPSSRRAVVQPPVLDDGPSLTEANVHRPLARFGTR